MAVCVGICRFALQEEVQVATHDQVR